MLSKAILYYKKHFHRLAHIEDTAPQSIEPYYKRWPNRWTAANWKWYFEQVANRDKQLDHDYQEFVKFAKSV